MLRRLLLFCAIKFIITQQAMKKICFLLVFAITAQVLQAQTIKNTAIADTAKPDKPIVRETTHNAGFLNYVATHSKVVRTIVYIFKK